MGCEQSRKCSCAIIIEASARAPFLQVNVVLLQSLKVHLVIPRQWLRSQGGRRSSMSRLISELKLWLQFKRTRCGVPLNPCLRRPKCGAGLGRLRRLLPVCPSVGERRQVKPGMSAFARLPQPAAASAQERGVASKPKTTRRIHSPYSTTHDMLQ